MGGAPTLPPVGLTCALKGPQDHLRGECTATRAFSANTQRKPLLSHTSNSCHLRPNARQQRHSKRTPGSSTGYKRPSNPRAGMRHPHRHAARTLGHAPSAPVRETPSRVVTTQTGSHSPLPRSRRQLTPRLVLTRRIRQGGPDPHRVWPACRKQCLEHADHADTSLLSTTRPSSSKVPMASRRRISSGQCAMKSRASTV